MTKALVLGGGMVGSLMARDLASDPEFQVTLADVDETSLQRASQSVRLETAPADLSDPHTISKLARDFDIVLGALPSRFGFAALRAVLEAGRNYCDISFMPENALDLDALAMEKGVTAVVDCGVAPGMSNLLSGYGARKLDRCDNIEIYVGGLPVEREWPYEYKAGFAPTDVIEEYTRPARYVVDREVVVREALSEPELMDFAGVGALEAFNTDGLRSLIDTLDVPHMKEKTLRYPGHIELMRVLRETGFFSQDEIEMAGQRLRPMDLTAQLLFPKWTYEEGEADLTVMRVLVEGEKDGQRCRLQWDLLDYYDPEMNARSMSRTTAYPCAIIARMIAAGRIEASGVLPPELLAGDETLVRDVLHEHERRGVVYTEHGV